MPIATATALAIGAGVSAVGAVGQVVASGKAATAAERTAAAQSQAAKEQIAAQRTERLRIEKLAREAAAPSQEELDQISALVKTSEEGLTRASDLVQKEADLLRDIDPAIQESAQNVTALLRGQQASILKPLRDQRRRQRGRLEQQLRARLGPGFRTSSAGIQALDQFESSNDLLFADAQQKALSNVSQTLTSITGARGQITEQTTRAFSPFIQAQLGALEGTQRIEDRQLKAATAGTGVPIDFAAGTRTAGGEFAGDVIRAQTFGDIAGSVGGIGKDFLTAGLGEVFKKKAAAAGSTSKVGEVDRIFGSISAGEFRPGRPGTAQAGSLFELSQSRK